MCMWRSVYNSYVIVARTPGADPAFWPQTTFIATLFGRAVETVLPGVLAGFPSALLAVRGLKSDGQPGFVNQIGHAAQVLRPFQATQIGILPAERCQPLFQAGIVGVDVCCAFFLVEQDDGFLLNLRQSRHCQPPWCHPRCDSK